MADALDLAHRLPQTWARVQALEVKVSYARLVARKTRDLTKEQAGFVDERVAESADGRVPWSRFELLVLAAVKAADVLDIEGQAPVDAYEVPDRHRQAVHLMTPADTFPHSPNLSRSQQIDHTIAFQHGAAAKGAGQSRLGNYGKLTVLHHRIKT